MESEGGPIGANRILVVKLSALGNLVLSFGAFAAIRRHHPEARITLLTTGPYASWMREAPWFDEVWVDRRPAWWDTKGVLALRRRLNEARFDRVYDLQTSGRSSRYFALIRPRPEWSGIASGCSHPDRDPRRDILHDHERLTGQLRQAGIASVPPPDVSWCAGDLAGFGLPDGIALLVPGSSAHRLTKRWPVGRYGALARDLAREGLTPVVLGSAAEAPLAVEIARHAGVIDLTAATDFGQIASLARVARIAVGNDTGPMHLIAAACCPSVVLFSSASDPALCAPRGRRVAILRRPSLEALEVTSVRDAALGLLAPAPV